MISAVVWLVAIVLVIFAFAAQRGRRRQIGAAASGTVYDLLNEDKRNAVELIVEQRAEARDPEDRDGNPRRPPAREQSHPTIRLAPGEKVHFSSL